ncbi:MAG TPA: site-2 protease family protein [Armatimonadota bacterium]|nr:site-2 protease family protein [Armatimonadota bacterium]
MEFNLQFSVMVILALIIAIPVHEFAHALSAVNNGDDGPRRDGRLSIMPWDHFDPLGALFCVVSAVGGVGLGWGKPVMVNPGVLRNQRWDMCKIAAWGPFSNFLLAIGFALLMRFGAASGEDMMWLLLWVCLKVNLSLMFFNLIPIGPLDGAKIVAAFLPDRQAYEFSRFSERYGMIMLLGLITLGRPLLRLLVSGPASQLAQIMVPGVF